jgi:diamine N-acetyltransferase
MEIRWLDKHELPKIHPFLVILNDGYNNRNHLETIDILQELNYLCVAAEENGETIGIIGVWPLFKHYAGKHLELDNVMVKPECRGQDIAPKMIEFIYQWGKENGYESMELNCYLKNTQGLDFWTKNEFEKLGMHMRKKIV